MPQITININDKKRVEKLYKEMSVNVANIIDITPERIFVLTNENTICKAGEIQEDLCIVSISWVQRSYELREKVATSIISTLKENGIKEVKLTFKDIIRENVF